MRKWAVAAALVSFALLCAVIWRLYRVTRTPQSAFITPAPSKAPVYSTPTPAPTLSPEEELHAQADVDFMAGRVNILLLGYDQSPEREQEDSDVYRGGKNGFRSDVLILLAVNFNQGTAHLISIPRDTYSPIYNTRGRWKINAAFAKGGGASADGFTYAVKTVEMLFGVPISYYAGVNMEGLKRLVDAMGGVEYDVDIAFTLNGRAMEKGRQHLNGQQVLDYCRVRKGVSTDVGRVDRQQRMLFAIFDQLRQSGSLAKLPRLYSAVKDDIQTDLSLGQIAALAAFALELDASRLKRTTLEGEYVSNVYNASYYVLENKKLTALVKSEFGVDMKRDKKYDLATVKRDKAAAEARRAAEKLDAVEGILLLPADTSSAADQSAILRARAARDRLMDCAQNGGSAKELSRLTLAYHQALIALVDRFGAAQEARPLLPTLSFSDG